MSTPGLAARRAAVALLHDVLMKKQMIAEILESAEAPLNGLEPGERARAQSIANSVLRNLDPIDTVLDQFLQKSPPFKVRNILRVATNEMVIDGIAPHAAVDAAVRLVRESPKTSHMKGLTNAVARRVSEHGAEIWAEMDPQPLPSWIAKPVGRAFGEQAVHDIEAAHAKIPPLDITVTADAEKWAETLAADLLPTGSLRLTTPGQITNLPGYSEGAWWIQDAAAAIPARLLGDIADKQVLDLCAAPGGKTMQLAAAGAEVTAVDVSEPRLKRVRANLKRTGLSADIIAKDVLKWTPSQKYDAILLDAPCSATGTIRRHPDLPFAKDGELGGLLRMQQRMLLNAYKWLKPGGKLVYCTCSLLSSEGAGQIQAFLAATPDAKMLPVADQIALPTEFIGKDGGLRTRPDMWPDIGGLDGFYAAVIQKP